VEGRILAEIVVLGLAFRLVVDAEVDGPVLPAAVGIVIVGAEADDVLALKDHHPSLCEDVSLWLDTEATKGALPVHETVDKDHGRIEVRRYLLSNHIGWLEQKPDWAGLSAVGRVESLRTVGGKTTTKYRYYLCSFADLERFAEAARGHWATENSQHWVLDVQFGEDAHRGRKDHSAQNLGLVRRMSLNVIRHNDPDSKRSLRRCKRLALLNNEYRSQLIFGEAAT
jgi:predicted transposase YbfD/YdcC